MRIETVLKEAQDGQALANVARAFHLPRAKASVAFSAMVRELIPLVEKRSQARRSLASLVEMLGRAGYEQVLETPALLGATHTQVLGTDALKFFAGHASSAKIAHDAAAEAEVSEMIAEYLLPVVAAMLVGAMARLSRAGIAAVVGGASAADVALPASEPDHMGINLPRVSGGFGFSGSTGGGVAGATTIAVEQYLALAEDIRRTDRPLGATDPVPAVRRVLESSLGIGGARGWLDRILQWRKDALSKLLVRRHRL